MIFTNVHEINKHIIWVISPWCQVSTESRTGSSERIPHYSLSHTGTRGKCQAFKGLTREMKEKAAFHPLLQISVRKRHSSRGLAVLEQQHFSVSPQPWLVIRECSGLAAPQRQHKRKNSILPKCSLTANSHAVEVFLACRLFIDCFLRECYVDVQTMEGWREVHASQIQ